MITTKGVDELVQSSSLVGKAIVQCLCREFILIGARFGEDQQMEVAQELVDVDGYDAQEVKANENMPASGINRLCFTHQEGKKIKLSVCVCVCVFVCVCGGGGDVT